MAKPKPRTSKLNAWFRAYTDEANQATFPNKTESARVAGYKTESENSLKSIGCQNFTKLNKRIDKWLDETGLSESALKTKIVSLMNGKQTIYHKVKGAVSPGDLPPGWRIVATSGIVMKAGRKTDGDEEEEVFGDGDTLLACDIEFPELQRRTLDMALKVKGLYAAEKREVTGKDGAPIEHKVGLDDVVVDLLSTIAGATRGLPNRTQDKIREQVVAPQ